MSNETKSKNPLYVVTNDGKDVESAENYIELFFKKAGLDFVYKFVIDYLEALIQSVNSYPMLVEIRRLIDQAIEALSKVVKVLPF